MLSFKTFITESRFSTISPNEEKQAELLLKNFRQKYNTLDKIQKLKHLARKRRVAIGTIKVVDLATNKPKVVTVYISRNTASGHYKIYDPLLQKKDIIVLNYIKALNHKDIDGIDIYLKHELRHSIQQFKQSSEEYVEHQRKTPGYEDLKYYYTDAAEIDAQETEVLIRLKKYLTQLQIIAGENAVIYTKLINKFKKELMIFLIKPWNDKEVQDNLPKPLWQKDEMLDTLSKHPKFWKRFKLKIKTFLDEIDKY